MLLAPRPGHGGTVEFHEGREILARGGAFETVEGGDAFGGGRGRARGFDGGAARLELGRDRVLLAEVAEDGEAVGDLGGDDGARQGEGAGGVAIGFELGQAKLDVMAAGRGERAAELALVGEEAEGDAFFEQLGQGLRGHLDVAEQEHGFELVIGEVEEDFVFLFDQEAVAGLAEDGALLGEVQIGHGRVPRFRWCGRGWRQGSQGGAFERHFEGVAGRGELIGGAAGGRERRGHEKDAALGARVLPGDPDGVALEEGAEELEAVLEIGDAGFIEIESEVGGFEKLGALEEGLVGLVGGLGEDDEVVGIADQFAAALFEFAVEILEEEVGEQGGNGGALGNAAADGADVGAVPALAADPEAEEGHYGFAGLAFGEALEEEVGVDAVEKALNVGVGDEDVAELAALADAGDGAVDGAAGAVAVAAFEELLLEGAGEVAGDGGLKDAVADGGDQEGAGLGGAGVLLDDDLEERVRAVEALLDAGE